MVTVPDDKKKVKEEQKSPVPAKSTSDDPKGKKEMKAEDEGGAEDADNDRVSL